MSAQLQVFVSVWESVLLGIRLAGICLATCLGEGRANILLVSVDGGGLSACVLVSLSLAGHPSIHLGWFSKGVATAYPG